MTFDRASVSQMATRPAGWCEDATGEVEAPPFERCLGDGARGIARLGRQRECRVNPCRAEASTREPEQLGYRGPHEWRPHHALERPIIDDPGESGGRCGFGHLCRAGGRSDMRVSAMIDVNGV